MLGALTLFLLACSAPPAPAAPAEPLGLPTAGLPPLDCNDGSEGVQQELCRLSYPRAARDAAARALLERPLSETVPALQQMLESDGGYAAPIEAGAWVLGELARRQKPTDGLDPVLALAAVATRAASPGARRLALEQLVVHGDRAVQAVGRQGNAIAEYQASALFALGETGAPALEAMLARDRNLLWKLTERTPVPDGLHPALAKALVERIDRTTNPVDRRQLTRRLARVPTDAALQRMAEALFDSDPGVRHAAGRGLHESTRTLPSLAPTLERALEQVDQAPTACLAAAKHGPRDVGPLRAASLQADVAVAASCAAALAEVSSRPETRTVEHLSDLYRQASRAERVQLATALGAFGARSETAVPVLLEDLVATHEAVRGLGTTSRALVQLGPGGVEALERLYQGDERSREKASLAYEAIRTSQPHTDRFLIRGLEAEPVDRLAVLAAAGLEAPSPVLVEGLVKRLPVTIEALGALGPAASAAVPALTRWLESEATATQAARALVRIGSVEAMDAVAQHSSGPQRQRIRWGWAHGLDDREAGWP